MQSYIMESQASPVVSLIKVSTAEGTFWKLACSSIWSWRVMKANWDMPMMAYMKKSSPSSRPRAEIAGIASSSVFKMI
jgi:hypothetical protein